MEQNEIVDEMVHFAALCAEKRVAITRADLSYRIKAIDEDLAYDSVWVSQFVNEMYATSGNDLNIKHSFINNNKSKTLVDEYKLFELATNNKLDEVISIGYSDLNITVDSLKELYEVVKGVDSVEANDSIALWLDTHNSIDNIKEIASVMLAKYFDAVQKHACARSHIYDLINDVAILQHCVSNSKNDVKRSLYDVLGEDVEREQPDLFESSVPMLEAFAGSLFASGDMDFSLLVNQAYTLISEVIKGYEEQICVVSNSEMQLNTKRLKLLIDSIEIAKLKQRTAEEQMQYLLKIQKEFLMMEAKIKGDFVKIKSDYNRMHSLCLAIKFLMLDKCQEYANSHKQLLSAGLKSALDSVYAQVEEANGVRAQIKNEILQLNIAGIDHFMNSGRYEATVRSGSKQLDAFEDRYKAAVTSKPEEEGVVFSSYNRRKLFEWNHKNNRLVKAYARLEAEREYYTEQYKAHNIESQRLKVVVEDKYSELDELEKTVRSSLKVDKKVKSAVADSLAGIKELLLLANGIINNRIDSNAIMANINVLESRVSDGSSFLVDGIDVSQEMMLA